MAGFAALKQLARQTVHETFAAPASYMDDGGMCLPVTVRWATKLGLNGGLDGDYAQVIENIDRIVFNRSELDEIGLTPRKRGVVSLSAYGVTFELDTPAPMNGREHVIWYVVPHAAG